jgi:hypothetical protein
MAAEGEFVVPNYTLGLLGAVSILLAGCVTVPQLEPNNIRVSEVIERVRCDLADALPDEAKYPWTADWVARIDLTLVVNEQAGFTPTVSFIDLRRPEIVPGIGTFMQNFTLGVGAGANSTAVRNDNMTFTVSLEELRYKRQTQACTFSSGIGLDGDLGLKEWVASALEPVDRGLLTVGYHPSVPGRSRRAPRPPRPGTDPPIDAISHQVQFIVVLSGSISPNWTLTRFRGPTVSGNLAAASRSRTHTLGVVLASPRLDKSGVSPHATEAMRLQFQQLQQTLRTAP